MENADHAALDQKAQEVNPKTEAQMSNTQPIMEAVNGNGGWNAGLGGAIGALLGSNGFLGGNRNDSGSAPAAPAAPAVTPDQLQTALGNLQGQIQRDQLQTQIGDLSANVAGIKAGVDSAVAGAVGSITGAVGGVKDTVVAGNQQTAMSLCQLGNAMQQGFGALNNTVVAEAAATRARIDQMEIGNLRDKLAERDLRIAEIQAQARHAETQNIIVNTNANANANASAGNNCANQLTQALQLAALLRQNQCCPTGTGAGTGTGG